MLNIYVACFNFNHDFIYPDGLECQGIEEFCFHSNSIWSDFEAYFI